MKVMKFGGTSVGSVKSILSLKKIVETEARTQPVVVVVSALDGITDALIATSQLALKGDERWKEEFDAMVTRHHQMIDTVILDNQKRVDLFNTVDQLFEQLKSIYYGVFLIHKPGILKSFLQGSFLVYSHLSLHIFLCLRYSSTHS